MKFLDFFAAYIAVMVAVEVPELLLQSAIVVNMPLMVIVVPVIVCVSKLVVVPSTIVVPIVMFVPVVGERR